MLTVEQRARWSSDGFFVVRGWASENSVSEMRDRAVALARSEEAGHKRPDLIFDLERRLADSPTPEGRLSKVFRIMRSETVFREFATDPRLLALLSGLLGDDIDCFLSQFIFKNPGALGQPWHQDEWYFRFDPPTQVGIWLAVTKASLENGPLWVVPGSHSEELHENVVSDPREGASLGYIEIQCQDTSSEEPVLMEPGDLLVFDAHLRHRSTDNLSDQLRAAMVYHYSPAGTAYDSRFSFNHDWVPVLRGGAPVEVDPKPVPIDWSSLDPSVLEALTDGITGLK